MDDETDIGFVDTHTEGDSGHNHLRFFHQEGVLVFHARLGIQTCMVGECADFVHLQETGKFFHLFATETVHNTRFSRMVFDEFDNFFVDILRFLPDFIIEIGTIEGGDEHFGFVHAEILLYVGLHFGRCRRCQRDDRHLGANGFDDGTDAAVFRTEVVSPFRDTMRFVNGIK